jgi:RNA polymerase sigma factor (sigma-70 family)
VRRGDVGAFAELYRAHVVAVRSVVAHQIAGDEVISDVVQEVFARALERLHTLRQPDQFRSWVLTIAHNTAIDARRERDRVRWVSDGDIAERPSNEDGPETLAELAELGQLVNVALAGLARRDLIALALATNLGFSPAEIGAALGVSPGAAKVIVHRARGRLRTALSMELMVRRRGAGCPEFADLFDVGDDAKAARHVRECMRCQALASGDVELFAVVPPAGGAT